MKWKEESQVRSEMERKIRINWGERTLVPVILYLSIRDVE